MSIEPSGRDAPQFIYGTAWKEEETRELTKLALVNGFRAVDTANQRKHYVEAAVGEALEEAFDDEVVDRDEMFIQTKFTYQRGQDHRLPYDPDAKVDQQVEQSFESSLDHLGVEYVDSYLLHGPSSRVGLTEKDWRVWDKMQELSRSGRTDAIGVSNVTADQLELLVDGADIAPAYVQNRCYARTGWDQRVREICEANGIGYQAFSLLTANTRELRTDEVVHIARGHDRTVPQIIFRFALHVGMIPLTGTTSQQHMQEDLAIDEFELDAGEVEAIEGIARA